MPDIDIPALLTSADTIAVVGLSARSSRTSHQIAKRLQSGGYDVRPVNPVYDEVLGVPSVATLSDLADEVDAPPIDIVNVFRAPEHTADVVRDAIAYADATGTTPTIWTQLGVSSPDAEALAEDAGLPYIRNRCIAVELNKAKVDRS